jgi:hypothetical protein
MILITHDLEIMAGITDRVHLTYAQAVPSAVPVPDPSIERHRRRTLLTGDVRGAGELTLGLGFTNPLAASKEAQQTRHLQPMDPSVIDLGGGQLAACDFPGGE